MYFHVAEDEVKGFFQECDFVERNEKDGMEELVIVLCRDMKTISIYAYRYWDPEPKLIDFIAEEYDVLRIKEYVFENCIEIKDSEKHLNNYAGFSRASKDIETNRMMNDI